MLYKCHVEELIEQRRGEQGARRLINKQRLKGTCSAACPAIQPFDANNTDFPLPLSEPSETTTMESEAHAVYRGRPLDLHDSFHLLQLLPGHLDEPVRIRLFSAQLSAAPSYEALSYTWGDPTLTSVIEALSDKGEDEHKPGVEFRSTANCHAALKRLRNPDANRVLWVGLHQPVTYPRAKPPGQSHGGYLPSSFQGCCLPWRER